MGLGPQAHGELFALRQTIARIEGKPDHAARLAAGLDQEGQAGTQGRAGREGFDLFPSTLRFDDLMVELLMSGLMVELRGERLQQAGTTTGFALALAIMGGDQAAKGGSKRLLFIADPDVVREAGLVYAPGLVDFGLDPAELVHALPRRIEDALWLAEAALVSRAFSSVVLEVHGNPKKFGLTESRRLSLKARGTGGRLFVLRQAGEEEASSASLRLSVQTAPAAARILANGTLLGGSIGFPAFRILAEKSRFPGQTELILEWNPDDRRLHPLADTGTSGIGSPDPLPLLSTARDRSHRTQALGSVVAFGPMLNRAS
ncbi:protein ImuA [Rhizobium sp. AG855]|nr:protein ImuA [Rhizobium sp. AG855]